MKNNRAVVVVAITIGSLMGLWSNVFAMKGVLQAKNVKDKGPHLAINLDKKTVSLNGNSEKLLAHFTSGNSRYFITPTTIFHLSGDARKNEIVTEQISNFGNHEAATAKEILKFGDSKNTLTGDEVSAEVENGLIRVPNGVIKVVKGLDKNGHDDSLLFFVPTDAQRTGVRVIGATTWLAAHGIKQDKEGNLIPEGTVSDRHHFTLIEEVPAELQNAKTTEQNVQEEKVVKPEIQETTKDRPPGWRHDIEVAGGTPADQNVEKRKQETTVVQPEIQETTKDRPPGWRHDIEAAGGTLADQSVEKQKQETKVVKPEIQETKVVEQDLQNVEKRKQETTVVKKDPRDLGTMPKGWKPPTENVEAKNTVTETKTDKTTTVDPRKRGTMPKGWQP